MELFVHIVVGLAIAGLIYEYVKLIKGYVTLADAYEQLESEAFYNEKEYQKLNEELTVKVERLEAKLTTSVEPATKEVVKPKPVRKKSVSKKTPSVE